MPCAMRVVRSDYRPGQTTFGAWPHWFAVRLPGNLSALGALVGCAERRRIAEVACCRGLPDLQSIPRRLTRCPSLLRRTLLLVRFATEPITLYWMCGFGNRPNGRSLMKKQLLAVAAASMLAVSSGG